MSGCSWTPEARLPTRSSSPEYVTVARLADLPPGSLLGVQSGGRWYALANVDGVVHAFDNNCPHNGGPLARGELTGREVTCPWHGWRWDATSGRNNWPGTDWRLPKLPVRIVGDGEIQLPAI